MTQVYTREEVAKHNDKSDAWFIIHGEVFDISKFFDDHPGGREVLLPLVGADATAEFDAVHHSKDAKKLLSTLKIGTLDGGGDKRVFRLREIANKRTPEGCYLAINNKVYDLTDFLDSHPGGRDVLLYQGGMDASQAFFDIGHSNNAHRMMQKFCVGELHPEDCRAPPGKKSLGGNTSANTAEKKAISPYETNNALHEFVMTQIKVTAIVIGGIAMFIYLLL